MGSSRLLVILTLLCLGETGLGQESLHLESLPKETVHLFLLAGQSNMAGRGTVSEEDRSVHPRVFMLSKDWKWVPAVDPIHYGKKGAGVGPGKSFAVALAEQDEEMVIGLIPAACGGSPISTWEPGGYHKQTKSYPYDEALERTRCAMQDGVLKGTLWHQGESDCRPEAAAGYQDKLKQLICRFRRDIAAGIWAAIYRDLGENLWE